MLHEKNNDCWRGYRADVYGGQLHHAIISLWMPTMMAFVIIGKLIIKTAAAIVSMAMMVTDITEMAEAIAGTTTTATMAMTAAALSLRPTP